MTPLVAFCFHDSQLTGATVWLKSFLLSGAHPAPATIAILPGPSPLEEILDSAGIAHRRIVITPVALGGVPAGRRVSVLGNRIAAVNDYRRIFRECAPGLVYVNSSVQIAPILAARMAGIPVLVHVHEGWRSRTHRLKRYVVRHHADAVVFAARSGMEVFGPPLRPGTWEVSPNGVDPALGELRARREELRASRGFQQDEAIVLYLGTLSSHKGIHELAECWPRVVARFPKARLIMAGRVDTTEPDDTIKKIASQPPARAEFLGYRTDSAELLAASDLFVLPSYGEAMPLSISEAMMIGTPVVARDVGDIRWQIGEGRGFLFTGSGAEPLEHALIEALSDPDEARQRAERAREFATRHLTAQRQNEQIVRMMRLAMDSRRG